MRMLKDSRPFVKIFSTLCKVGDERQGVMRCTGESEVWLTSGSLLCASETIASVELA